MAKVTYRGVAYDTNDKKKSVKSTSQLTYRGVQYDTETRLQTQQTQQPQQKQLVYRGIEVKGGN